VSHTLHLILFLLPAIVVRIVIVNNSRVCPKPVHIMKLRETAELIIVTVSMARDIRAVGTSQTVVVSC
jgi:hypothetical protein